MYNRDIAENSMGSNGFEFINDTAVHVAPQNQFFCALQIVEDTSFATMKPLPTGNTITGETIIAGSVLYGSFENLSLAFGKVIAYKGV